MAVVDIFKNQYQSYSDVMNKWFFPWYPEDDSWTPGHSNLNSEWQKKTRAHLAGMAESCVEDMERLWGRQLDFTPDSVKLLDEWITPSWRHYLQSKSDPGNFANQFLVVICEFGAYLLQVIEQNCHGKIIPRAPYWDSSVIVGDKEIFPFIPVIQRFSDEMNHVYGLNEFYQTMVLEDIFSGGKNG